ncbi:MAG: KpsF/GutQ family sugar-phosphate isomerase [Proteobacteria bacterium]|nr:KpsF/GutQ family sugar-phosphate isomerase [Pseudomonadota bacterium]
MVKKPTSAPSSEAASRTLATARQILALEASAISAISDRLDDDFHAAVCLIRELSPGGRLVLSGMGKAGFIAQKISATFASIGTPSFFLHPAEAIHGDLGRFTKNDVVMILSNSGETPEIARIIPHIKRFGCPIIALTGAPQSTLGSYSDITLSIGALSEAGPHGLAPTTSTTAMLALGDALAMTVYEHHGFSREQFATYHPGGSIGRSLLKVREIMRAGDELCVVPQGLKVKEVLHRISQTKGRPGAAAIVADDGTLVGIFTDGDLRRGLERGGAFLDAPISDFMGREPKVIDGERFVTEALALLSHFKIDQVLVVDSLKKPLGLIDIQDLVEFRFDTP